MALVKIQRLCDLSLLAGSVCSWQAMYAPNASPDCYLRVVSKFFLTTCMTTALVVSLTLRLLYSRLVFLSLQKLGMKAVVIKKLSCCAWQGSAALAPAGSREGDWKQPRVEYSCFAYSCLQGTRMFPRGRSHRLSFHICLLFCVAVENEANTKSHWSPGDSIACEFKYSWWTGKKPSAVLHSLGNENWNLHYTCSVLLFRILCTRWWGGWSNIQLSS